MEVPNDLDLIADILAGNVNAFRFIIKRYKNMAYATSYSILRNKEEAEDSVQESFIKAYEHLGTFKAKSKFSTWLFRIIYYTALTKCQKTKYQKNSIQWDESDKNYLLTTPNEGPFALHEQDRNKFVSKAIEQLSPEDRLAITLYYVEEKSHPEIAEMTGWSVSNVKVRIHRARQKMNHYLNRVLLQDRNTLL